MLALERVEAEEAQERQRTDRRKRDPRHDELMDAARQGQPQDASEYLRQRAERLAKSKG